MFSRVVVGEKEYEIQKDLGAIVLDVTCDLKEKKNRKRGKKKTTEVENKKYEQLYEQNNENDSEEDDEANEGGGGGGGESYAQEALEAIMESSLIFTPKQQINIPPIC